MSSRHVDSYSARYTWPTDKKGDIDVFFEGTCLARIKAVLANMKAIISCIDNICVIEKIKSFKVVHYSSNKVINRCECSEPKSV